MPAWRKPWPRSLTPIARDFGLELRVAAADLLVRPAARTEVAVYRVAQEAATNTVRHPGASAVDIRLATRASSGDRTDCQRRGIGVRADQVLAETGPRPFGLLGMRERVELLGGDFHLETTVGCRHDDPRVDPDRRRSVMTSGKSVQTSS